MYREAIVAVERAGDMRTSYLKSNPLQKRVVNHVPVDAVFRGDLYSPFDAPVSLNTEPPALGDRVFSLTAVGVPIGLKGTVVCIHAATGFVEVRFKF